MKRLILALSMISIAATAVTINRRHWMPAPVLNRTYDEAEDFCKNYGVEGEEWRLPVIWEAKQLVDTFSRHQANQYKGWAIWTSDELSWGKEIGHGTVSLETGHTEAYKNPGFDQEHEVWCVLELPAKE